MRGVDLVCPIIPGFNQFDYASLHPEGRLTTFFLPPFLHGSYLEGRVRLLPLSYLGIARFLENLQADVAFLHLTRSSEDTASFGISADFGPLIFRHARKCIGFLNSSMPQPRHSPRVPLSGLDATVETDEAIVPSSVANPSDEASAIARNIARLIPDGAALQTGVGSTPGAIWRELSGLRDIRLCGGMVSEGFFEALDQGVVSSSARHLAGVAQGSAAFFRRLDGDDAVHFDHVRTTHNEALVGLDRFISVNGALEVDLSGQVNLETRDGQIISGVGGAPEFVRAALASRGGRAIIALPATASRGAISRIVPCLSSAPSLTRAEAVTVVTEYGVADLAGLSLEQRAERLIAVSAPSHRARLTDEISRIRQYGS
jgi:acyl-CoA hydrolase